MPDDGLRAWGPYEVTPGFTVNLEGFVSVSPGGDGELIANTASGRYVFTGAAGGGAGWTVIPAEGSAFALSGPQDLPPGTVLLLHGSAEDIARQEETVRLARVAEAERQKQELARQEAWRERTELADQRLLEWLSDEQRKTYEEYRWFSLTASDGSPWRIIADGSCSGNVLQLDRNGQPVCSYCAHPRSCPPSETYLAQSLAIVSDVARFKLVANPYYRYQSSVVNVASGEYASGAGAAAWSGLLQALGR